MNFNSIGTVKKDCSSASRSSCPQRHPPIKQLRYKRSFTVSCAFTRDHSMKMGYVPSGLASKIISRRTYRTSHFIVQRDMDNAGLNERKEQLCSTGDGDCQPKENIEQPDAKNCSSKMCLESRNFASSPHEGSSDLLNAQLWSRSGTSSCLSPQGSLYAATQYTEAKQSFTNTEVSECTSSVWRVGGCGETSNSCDFTEGTGTGIFRSSVSSEFTSECSSNSFSGNAMYKRHGANDKRWEAIQTVRARNNGALELKDFSIFKRLGRGDIGTVYLAELAGTGTFFAMKVMDKETLRHRKKISRAQTEREILQSLDHPFLPTLYTHFETENMSFLVMEFCPGGDLHALRQKQPGKFFSEHAARFYLAEVLLALEYLHMLGIVYRDLKPENILVRDDGHIMLSDFDLSLRCVVHPTLVKSSSPIVGKKSSRYCIQPACIEPSCAIYPACIRPTKERNSRPKTETNNQVTPLPELIVEPTSAWSMSFVGTHEYLAPEIIKGEGHGSAVDWWTLGIFLYELLFGKTPFKGIGNRATLFNVVEQPLRFPESPTVSFAARDLIRGLLVKEPQHRFAYRRGATEIKQHPFFQSVNWALIRCTIPPEVPPLFTMEDAGEPAPDQNNFYEMDFF